MWDSLQAIFNYLAAFILVLVLAYITIRFASFMINPQSRQGNIRIVERVPLDLRRGSTLYLVRVGTRYMLIGVSPSSINLIGEIQPAEIDLPVEQADDDIAKKRTFAEILQVFKKNRF